MVQKLVQKMVKEYVKELGPTVQESNPVYPVA